MRRHYNIRRLQVQVEESCRVYRVQCLCKLPSPGNQLLLGYSTTKLGKFPHVVHQGIALHVLQYQEEIALLLD